MKSSRIKACYALLGVLLLALILLNILIGSSSMTMGDALRILFSHDTVSKYGKIVWDIRMPRILAAALLGGALSVSGFLLQTFFANPNGAVLAYGQDFPDGLCGGSVANAMGGPLLLATSSKSSQAAAYAKANGIKFGAVLGGPTLISDIAVRYIFQMSASDKIVVK